MITIETAVTPIDYAYCSVKFLSLYYVYLLQDMYSIMGIIGRRTARTTQLRS